MQQNLDESHSILSKIRIIDNFLPDYDLEYFKNAYRFNELINNYHDDGSYIGSDGGYPEITKLILNEANNKLTQLGYGIIKEIRTVVLLTSDANSKFEKHRHVDDTHNDEFGYTLSYHWMGDNNAGSTVFYENFTEKVPLLQIPFKKNRLVIFPSRIPHEGSANTGYLNNSKRIIYALFCTLEHDGLA